MKRLTKTLLGLLLIVTNSCENIHGVIFQQDPDTKKGYNFPYFLFIPERTNKNEKLTIIVEPNNTGYVSDDLDDHIKGAKQMITNYGYLGKYLSDSLNYPLLIPVFPRSEKEWKTYTHALDRDAVKTKNDPIERIDLQLIAMIEDAKTNLTKMGYTVQDKFIMTGFSASATFANRFVSIHPDKVQVCAAGGLNGLLILPIKKLNGTPLKYPLGTYDFHDIFGDSIDLHSLKQVPQFFFMGETDDNDAAAYDDAYNSDERDIIYNKFSQEMMPGRWNFCIAEYQTVFKNVTFKTYKKTGHTITDEIRSDVLEFTRKGLFQNSQEK